MKKTLLVAALATGFAGVAHAESSVTLYGVVDAGYGITKQTLKVDGVTDTKTRDIGARNGVQNGNRWGLKGSEDLGNGTSAIFQLESGFTLGDGKSAQGGRLFGRQAFVGLTGESWGTFTIGRQYNAADSFVAPIDPFGTGFRQAAATTTFGSGISTRYDNAIKYVSPNFEGFQFGAGFVHSDVKEEETGVTPEYRNKLKGVTLGAGYNNGPLTLGVGFDYVRQYVVGSTATLKDKKVDAADTSVKSWSLGAAYDLEAVKLHVMYGQNRGGLIAANDSDGGNDDFGLANKTLINSAWNTKGLRTQAWLVGVSAPVGESGKVMFSYQGNRIKNKDAQFDGERVNTHVWSLGYRQGLSKRTSVYALASYGQAKYKNDAGSREKLKSTDVAVGLTHRF